MSVKFKQILENEKEKKWLESQVEKVADDCSSYIKRNQRLLKDRFHLVRGTSGEYKIEYQKPRERRKVFSPELLYFFNKFKPENFHRRDKTVPCFGGYLQGIFSHNPRHAVFPVGDNYTMYYNSGVSDFNYNNLIDDYDSLGNAPYKSLFNRIMDVATEVEKNSRKRYPDGLKKAAIEISYMDIHDNMSPKKIMSLYPAFMRFIFNYYDFLEENYSDVIGVYNDYKQYFKRYFSGLEKTKDLSRKMGSVEVSLYAPDGFYYVQFPNNKHSRWNKIISNIIQKSVS